MHYAFYAIAIIMRDHVSYRPSTQVSFIASYVLHHGAIMCLHECTCTLQFCPCYYMVLCNYLRAVAAVMTLMVFSFLLCDCNE